MPHSHIRTTNNKLHGPPMLVGETNFGLALDETSSYWSVKRISGFLCFSLANHAATHLRHHSGPISKTLCGPCIAATAGLTFKAPITTAADDIHKYFSLFIRENQTKSLDVSCESSARQRLHMKKIKPYFLRKIKVIN